MSGMSGWEVTEKIKSINDKVPVALITGWNVKLDESEMNDCRINFVVQKPFKMEQILNLVQEGMTLRDQLKAVWKKLEKKTCQQTSLVSHIQIKTLRGLLPICSSCKKIRDDQGYWEQIETYVRDHSEADFTHSICPECIKKLYPNLGEWKEEKFMRGKLGSQMTLSFLRISACCMSVIVLKNWHYLHQGPHPEIRNYQGYWLYVILKPPSKD